VEATAAIVDFVTNQVALPELDLRKRLTVSAGYGGAEVHVGEGSNLVGQPLARSLLVGGVCWSRCCTRAPS
jgi:ribosomal protein S6--L-glutamate ligase